MDDKIIAAARLAGWSDIQIEMASPAERERLERFYALAYRQGLEDAAKAYEQWDGKGEFEHVIFALKEQQHG